MSRIDEIRKEYLDRGEVVPAILRAHRDLEEPVYTEADKKKMKGFIDALKKAKKEDKG